VTLVAVAQFPPLARSSDFSLTSRRQHFADEPFGFRSELGEARTRRAAEPAREPPCIGQDTRPFETSICSGYGKYANRKNNAELPGGAVRVVDMNPPAIICGLVTGDQIAPAPRSGE
jgi:hypothetical protein